MRISCLFIIITSSFLISCNSKPENETVNVIPVTASNPKSIEFYRTARINYFNQEFVEAKSNFLTALRLDPNFILANLEINESNTLVKKSLVEKARNHIDNGNDYEKLYLSFLDSNNKMEKRKIASEIIQKYPNFTEGYELHIQTYNTGQERNQGIEILEELINKFPNSPQIFFQYIRFKYSGSENSLILKNDLKFYNEFLELSVIVLDKFPTSLRILNLLGQIFRLSINFDDDTRFDKALSYYQKAKDIVNQTGSSQKIQLSRNIGRTYLSNGKLSEALPYFIESIKLSDNSTQKITSYFDLFFSLFI
jgi:tetratricopeptide (TPR) repeat protein